MERVREHICKNGRKYRISNTERMYMNKEYPDGGFVIDCWIATDVTTGYWVYLDHSPNDETLREFIVALERLPPL